MQVLPDSHGAVTLGQLHRDGARVVYAVASAGSVATCGSSGAVVLGTHPALVALGLKDALARHAPSASLRPRTVVGPARVETKPEHDYVLKPAAGSGGRGIVLVVGDGAAVAVAEGMVLQDAVECMADADGHKRDLRLWMAVDGTGRRPPWVAHSSLVRVVRATDDFVTNTSAAELAHPHLRRRDWECFGEPHEEAARVARAFAESVRPSMAADPRPLWTLLGIDVAIDTHGRGWLLEVNLLPHADLGGERGRMYTRWFRDLLSHVEAVADVDLTTRMLRLGAALVAEGQLAGGALLSVENAVARVRTEALDGLPAVSGALAVVMAGRYQWRHEGDKGHAARGPCGASCLQAREELAKWRRAGGEVLVALRKNHAADVVTLGLTFYPRGAPNVAYGGSYTLSNPPCVSVRAFCAGVGIDAWP
jgi:hypothetical protein